MDDARAARGQLYAESQRRGTRLTAVGGLILIAAYFGLSWELVSKLRHVQALSQQESTLGAAIAKKTADLKATSDQLAKLQADFAAQNKAWSAAQAQVSDTLTAAQAGGHMTTDLAQAIEDGIGHVNAPPDTSARQIAQEEWHRGYVNSLCNLEEDARKRYKKAIDADPTFAPAYNSLGRLESDNNTPASRAEARTLFAKALSAQPDYLPALNNLARLEINEHHYAEAATVANQALRLHPDDPTAKRLLRELH